MSRIKIHIYQFLHRHKFSENRSPLHKKFQSVDRKLILKLSACLSLCLLCLLYSIKVIHADPYESKAAMQKDIASQIIRFHVIANSDSAEDQALKLKVKSALTEALRPKLSSLTDVNEARRVIEENLAALEALSEDIIQENGYQYTVTASLETGYFPIKIYGDLTLPPGQYEALRVEIGEAKGQNWWCIMFPPLCFVDATYSVVPKESKEQLKHVLTEDEYEAVFSSKKADVRVKFKLFELIKDYLSN